MNKDYNKKENVKETLDKKKDQINEENKYEDNPPKFFSIENAKKIEKKEILGNDFNQKDFDIHEYSINYLGKKFYRMTKLKDVDIVEKVYYYCNNHRTLKDSNELTSKGLRKRVSLCNARIIYIKSKKEFYTDWDHSSYCNKEKIPLYENIGDINIEIDNYKKLKKALINYLNSHPTIRSSDFIEKANKFYNKNKCQFKIEKNTFKNLYYNWRNNSLAFKKYSAIENCLTNNEENYLRDYSYITVYNKSGKSQFIHEHMIFISNYFIKKLRNAVHLYIDGTFVYPDEFDQLIIILYRDEESGVRYPGLYALINNKKEEGYKILFEKINYILTIENTENWDFRSYTIDFEKAIINATSSIFKDKRQIGCFYHYCRNIREHSNKMQIKPKEDSIAKKFLKDIYSLPFTYNKKKNAFNDLRLNYEKLGKNYVEFLDYFENQWKRYYENGMLNYIYLSKEQRSNSYIENYNRRIKLKLSKYLYGKNHCKISWPLFLYFIKKEEEEYRLKIFNLENELIIKGKKVEPFEKVKIIKKDDIEVELEKKDKDENENENVNYEKEIINEDKLNNTHMWFKWRSNSCRYDSFSLIYALILKPKIDEDKETPQYYILDYLNKLFDNCIYLTSKDYKKCFWNYLNNNKDSKVDLTTDLMCFKKKGSLYQILDLLRGNNIFCYEYKLEEGCTNKDCIKKLNSINYLNPYIVFKEEDLISNENILSKFNKLMRNEITACKKCGYSPEGEILDISNPTFYRIIQDKLEPKIIFVIFDLLNEYDIGTYSELEILEFQRRSQYNDKLQKILINELIINQKKYELKAMILTPESDHFTSLLLNYQNDIFNLKKGINYYYNGDTSKHEIVEENDLNSLLLKNIPYLGVYIEIK